MTTGELASSDTLGENLEERYFVLDGLEYGVDAQFSCELGPLDPVGIGGAGALRKRRERGRGDRPRREGEAGGAAASAAGSAASLTLFCGGTPGSLLRVVAAE